MRRGPRALRSTCRCQPPHRHAADCVQKECGRVCMPAAAAAPHDSYSQSTVSTRKHHGPVTGPRRSANFAFVAAEHTDGSLDVVRKRVSRLIAEYGLEHGEDALGRRRVGREGEDDPRCLGPRRRKHAAVDLPPGEHTLGEGVVVLGLGALRQDSRPRRSSRALSTRPTERRQIRPKKGAHQLKGMPFFIIVSSRILVYSYSTRS